MFKFTHRQILKRALLYIKRIKTSEDIANWK